MKTYLVKFKGSQIGSLFLKGEQVSSENGLFKLRISQVIDLRIKNYDLEEVKEEVVDIDNQQEFKEEERKVEVVQEKKKTTKRKTKDVNNT